jgi:hypothetical protein
MLRKGLALAELTPETVSTMNGFGRKVIGAMLKPALVLHKRGELGEKDVKGAQGGILDGMLGPFLR